MSTADSHTALLQALEIVADIVELSDDEASRWGPRLMKEYRQKLAPHWLALDERARELLFRICSMAWVLGVRRQGEPFPAYTLENVTRAFQRTVEAAEELSTIGVFKAAYDALDSRLRQLADPRLVSVGWSPDAIYVYIRCAEVPEHWQLPEKVCGRPVKVAALTDILPA